MIIAKFIYVIVIGYLMGSIPFGVLVSRSHGKVDILRAGSGKMGTTNVLRTAGTKAAALVLAGDLLKGIVPVALAGAIVGSELMVVGNFGLGALVAQVIAGLAAIAGHNWSIFLKFKGGRGVATYFGGLFALCPPAALIGGEVLFATAGLTRYMSVGSILGVIASYLILAPLTLIYKFPVEYLAYALIGGLVIIVMHKDNIYRLVSGTERKIGEKTPQLSPSPEKDGI